MSTIYDLDADYDDDVINVKKLLAALSQNINDDNVSGLAEILDFELPDLRRILRSLNHIDVVKW